MNWRLLSDTDKARNKLGRKQRRNAVKRALRRATILAGQRDPMAVLLFRMGELNDEQAFGYAHGDGHKLHHVIDQMNASPLLQDWGWSSPPLPAVPDSELISVPLPERTLQKSRRGGLLCRYTSPSIVLSSTQQGITELFDFLEREEVVREFRSACRFRVLEAATKLFRFGDLGHQAFMANSLGLVQEPLVEGDLEPVARAMRFDSFYQESRDRYAVMLSRDKLPRARGDWGACWASEVDRLINDIKIPLRLQRQVFLLNLNLGD
ncbi:MAG: hypothetical protein QOE70_953, partial [Chthoniobacter sp.]|nr:hypothetical protein [Chthoniobacter sp.]